MVGQIVDAEVAAAGMAFPRSGDVHDQRIQRRRVTCRTPMVERFHEHADQMGITTLVEFLRRGESSGGKHQAVVDCRAVVAGPVVDHVARSPRPPGPW